MLEGMVLQFLLFIFSLYTEEMFKGCLNACKGATATFCTHFSKGAPVAQGLYKTWGKKKHLLTVEIKHNLHLYNLFSFFHSKMCFYLQQKLELDWTEQIKTLLFFLISYDKHLTLLWKMHFFFPLKSCYFEKKIGMMPLCIRYNK